MQIAWQTFYEFFSLPLYLSLSFTPTPKPFLSHLYIIYLFLPSTHTLILSLIHTYTDILCMYIYVPHKLIH